MSKEFSNSLLMLLLLITLPQSLEGIYTEAWQDNTLTITCQNTAYVIITSARYYAPSNIVCTDWANAPAQTANHCNNRLSCSINTAAGAFYGDPCWGSSKKLEVNYGCLTCDGGHYLAQGTGCKDCAKGTYAPSGAKTSCTSCPTGKTVPSGQGASLSDCTWVPCPAAHYLNQIQGCRQCSQGTYSSGGTTSSCSNCPTGKTVAAGSGTSQSDCYWIPCGGAQYLDQSRGCRTCGAGTYSLGGTTSSCTKCPSGKTVGAGVGRTVSDCYWIPCSAAHYLDQQQGCRQCSQGTYSSGGTTSSCSNCPTGKTVAAGSGTSQSDCTWIPCPAAHYLDQVQGCRQCSEGTYSSGGTTSSCYNCPTGKTVAAGSGTSQSDCYWMPCTGGHFLNTQSGCQDCPEHHFSLGGMLTSCVPCPERRGAFPGTAANEQHCRIPLGDKNPQYKNDKAVTK
ncbi:hypothetical protein ACHWQZ_G018733 [Mnemiopsis leidyi]